MGPPNARKWLLPLAVAIGVGACTEFPTRPNNREPAISAVFAFPQVVGQGDSLLVTIIASDPDGDALVYDWETDARFVIKDAWGVVYAYNTLTNSQILYRSTDASPDDTAWIWCGVRDRKGGGDRRLILIPLRD